jgi:transcriptional regulator with XRE-family HTH domain
MNSEIQETLEDDLASPLVQLGRLIRAHRKALGVNATAASESAGISRVTWHRIEKGEPSVAIGAYSKAMATLGLTLGIATPAFELSDSVVPVRIQLSKFPQLKQLAWQVSAAETLSPLEAWSIYERNWRHINEDVLTSDERQLIKSLQLSVGGPAHV